MIIGTLMIRFSLFAVLSVAYPSPTGSLDLIELGETVAKEFGAAGSNAISRSSSSSSLASSGSSLFSITKEETPLLKAAAAEAGGWQPFRNLHHSPSSSSSMSSSSSLESIARDFIKYKGQLEAHGYHLSEDRLAVYSTKTHREIGNYIVPIDWSISTADHRTPLPPGYFKSAKGDILPQEYASIIEGESFFPGFYKTAHGNILPDGWVESNVGHYIIPSGYQVTDSGTILAPGWKDGGINAFAVPKDWHTKVKNMQLVSIPPKRHFPNNGKFPEGWIKDLALKKYRHPDWTLYNGAAFPPGHVWSFHPPPRLSFPSDIFQEVTTTRNRKIIIPKGWSLIDDRIIAAGLEVNVATTTTGSKVILPKGWTLGLFDDPIPPGLIQTSSGKIIPKAWFFDEETKRILPNNLDFELVGLKGGSTNPFTDNILTRAQNLGMSKSLVDTLSAKISPDGHSILLPGFKKFATGDIAPTTWKITDRGTLLPPSFKETVDGDILNAQDTKYASGHVFGPEAYKANDNKIYGFSNSNYATLAWRSKDPLLAKEILRVPKGYTADIPTKKVYAKGWGFDGDRVGGRPRPPGTQWLSLNGFDKPILVPTEKYSFTPSNQELKDLIERLASAKEHSPIQSH